MAKLEAMSMKVNAEAIPWYSRFGSLLCQGQTRLLIRFAEKRKYITNEEHF